MNDLNTSICALQIFFQPVLCVGITAVQGISGPQCEVGLIGIRNVIGKIRFCTDFFGRNNF